MATRLATATLPALVELRVGLFGDREVQAFAAKCTLPCLRHLALGCGGHGVELGRESVAKLAKSPIGKQLTTLELGRCNILPSMRAIIIGMKRLERFSASVGNIWGDVDPADATTAVAELRARFGDGFVSEDEDSFDYLLDGVAGLSKLTLAGRT